MDSMTYGSFVRPFVFGALLFFGSLLQGQDFLEDPKLTVKEVVIRFSGPKTVAEERLRGFLQTRTGQEFDAAAVDEDAKRLYESGSHLRS